MSDEREPVGSVAEEAAKLLGALQGWARDSGHDAATAASGAAAAFKMVNEHITTGGKDCRYCPICQAIGLVRQMSPEVKEHLSTAASSLLHAAAAAMSHHASPSEPESPLEKITLSEESWSDDHSSDDRS